MTSIFDSYGFLQDVVNTFSNKSEEEKKAFSLLFAKNIAGQSSQTAHARMATEKKVQAILSQVLGPGIPDVTEFTTLLDGVESRAAEFHKWMLSSAGTDFVEKSLPKLAVESARAKGAAGRAATKLIHEQDSSFDYTFKKFFKGRNIDSNKTLSSATKVIEETQFRVGAQKQKSKSFSFEVNLGGQTKKIHLFDPSKSGHFSTNKVSMLGGGSSFSLGVAPNVVSGFNSADSSLGFKGSFKDFQMHLFDQLSHQLDEATEKKDFTRAGELIDEFNSKIGSLWNFAGDQFSIDQAGTANQRAHAEVIQNSFRYIPGMGEKPPTGDLRELFEAMNKEGVHLGLSSGATGRETPSGIAKEFFDDPGYYVPAYKEAFKDVGDLTPLVPDEMKVPMFSGSKANPAQHPIQGVSFIGGFLNTPDQMTDPFGGSANWLNQEGSYLASMELTNEIQVSQPGKVHKISASSEENLIHEKIMTMIQGGKVDDIEMNGQRFRGLISPLEQGQPLPLIQDVTEVYDAGSRSWQPVDAQNVGQFKGKQYQPVLPKEVLGLSVQGELVRPETSPNVTETIMGLSSEADGTIAIHTSPVVSAVPESPNPILKVIGGSQGNHIKGHLTSTPDEIFQNFVRQADPDLPTAQVALSVSELKVAESRAVYQTGALQLSLDQYMQGIGNAKSAQQQILKLKDNPQAVLRELASGGQTTGAVLIKELQDAAQSQSGNKAIQDALAVAEEVFTKDSTVDQKLAAVARGVVALTGGTEKDLQKIASNVFAPLGDQMGVFGDEVTSMISHPEQMTPGQQANAQNWRMNKTKVARKDAVASVEKVLGTSFTGAGTMHFKGALAVRDEGYSLGMGQRASLEPRFFDLAMADDNSRTVMREITGSSRMASYQTPLEEFTRSLQPVDPTAPSFRGMGQWKLRDAMGTGSQAFQQQMGQEGLLVDLGLSDDMLAKINQRSLNHFGEESSKLSGHLYLPGGEDIRSMGQMTTSGGLERAKSSREIYQTFLDTVHKNKGDEEAVWNAWKTFRSELSTHTKDQVFGVPGAGVHGAYRGTVRGSAVLVNQAYGATLSSLLGMAGDTSRDQAQDLIFKGNQQSLDLMAEIRKNFQASAQKEGIGNQVFVSRAAAEKTFGDLISHYESTGDANLLEATRKQRDAFFQGQGVKIALGRDPAIGQESLGKATAFLDLSSASTDSQHTIRMAQEFMEAEEVLVNGKARTNLQQSYQIGTVQGLNTDWDGDRLKMFVVASEEGQEALSKMGGPRGKHGLTYGVMKQLAIENISDRAAQTRQQITSHAGQAMSQELADQVAHATVKTAVPMISNPLTHMKFALYHSGQNTQQTQNTLAMLEAMEQVPISAKRIAQQVEYTDIYKNVLNKQSNLLFSGTAAEKSQAAKELVSLAFGEAFDMMQVKDSAGKQWTVTAQELAESLVKASDTMESDKTLERIWNVFRKKGEVSQLTNDDITHLANFYQKSFSQVHGSIQQESADSIMQILQQHGSSTSQSTLNQINQQTKQRAASAPSTLARAMEGAESFLGKIPQTKAAMLAGGVAGLAGAGLFAMASPTFRPKDHHLDPELLFPDELNPTNVPSPNPIATPQAHIGASSYEAVVFNQGPSYNSQNMLSRVGAWAGHQGMDLSMQISDDRSKLNSATLSKYRNEIY